MTGRRKKEAGGSNRPPLGKKALFALLLLVIFLASGAYLLYGDGLHLLPEETRQEEDFSEGPLEVATGEPVAQEDGGVMFVGEVYGLKEEEINVYFEYGESISLPERTPAESKTSAGSFSYVFEEARSGRDYYFRAVLEYNSKVEKGDIFIARVPREFEEEMWVGEDVKITTLTATEVDATSATLRGGITLSGREEAEVMFRYGGRENRLAEKTDKEKISGTSQFSHAIDGLSPGEDYYFKAVAEINGSILEKNILSFETPTINIIRNGASKEEILKEIRDTDGRLRVTALEGRRGSIVVETENASEVEFFLADDATAYIDPASQREESTQDFLDNYEGDGCPEVPEEVMAEFRLKEASTRDINRGDEVVLFFYGHDRGDYLISRVVIKK